MLTQPACAGGGRGMRARGVAVAPAVPGGAGAGGPRVAVRAPIVVASAGTLHTPALLLRSGLDGGGRVGANLRLHPATVGIAFFPKVPSPSPLWLPPRAAAGKACPPRRMQHATDLSSVVEEGLAMSVCQALCKEREASWTASLRMRARAARGMSPRRGAGGAAGA